MGFEELRKAQDTFYGLIEYCDWFDSLHRDGDDLILVLDFKNGEEPEEISAGSFEKLMEKANERILEAEAVGAGSRR